MFSHLSVNIIIILTNPVLFNYNPVLTNPALFNYNPVVNTGSFQTNIYDLIVFFFSSICKVLNFMLHLSHLLPKQMLQMLWRKLFIGSRKKRIIYLLWMLLPYNFSNSILGWQTHLKLLLYIIYSFLYSIDKSVSNV